MTRIDFYVLESDNPLARARTACRLAEKAYGQGLKIYIHTGSEAASRSLDDLLWTFRAGSFLPHALSSDLAREAELPPILIGHSPEPAGHSDVLINLAGSVPLFFGRFERVAEVIDQDQADLAQARERYKFYRERGYTLHSHRLKP